MNTYIGYSQDIKTREKGTSGGIGSTILKYMFDANEIQTAISFEYDVNKKQYVPKLIYSYEGYEITGSIYHEIDMFGFIKKNINEIKGSIFLFLLPCQVRGVTSLLDKQHIKHFIVSLTCSSQLSIEATYFLLKTQKIDRNSVLHIQYRGNGWPGGITIMLKNNMKKFFPNNNSIWTEIFHSRLFIQKRCFKCNETISRKSDISLADPWLKEYIENEKIGKTLILTNTEQGKSILEQAEEDGVLIKLDISEENMIKSQISTIQRKSAYRLNAKLMKKINSIISNSMYRNFFLKNLFLFKIHNKLIHFLERKLMSKNAYFNQIDVTK